MKKNSSLMMDINVNTKEVDKAIKKMSQLIELLKKANDLINSLGSVYKN